MPQARRSSARPTAEARGRSASPAPAGYSGTPLPKKLGIKEGSRVALLNAPKPLPAGLSPLPPGVTVSSQLRGTLDVIVLFAIELRPLPRAIHEAAARLVPNGGLWVAWPKKASGVPTDVTENQIREIALAAGLVDNKVCAIDAIWSGLRCVFRLKDRPR